MDLLSVGGLQAGLIPRPWEGSAEIWLRRTHLGDVKTALVGWGRLQCEEGGLLSQMTPWNLGPS